MKNLPKSLYFLLGLLLCIGLTALVLTNMQPHNDIEKEKSPVPSEVLPLSESSAEAPHNMPEEVDVKPIVPLYAATDDGFKVIVYYPSWKGNQLDKLRFEIVTHVNYAFAIPTVDGELRQLYDPALVRGIIKKAHDNNAKALLAVGGWSYNNIPLEETFRLATETPEKARKLSDAILATCDEYDFDGVDMDWEYPRLDDGSNAQYEDMMLYLSEKLHAKGKLLTTAVMSGANPDGTVHYDAAAYSDQALAAVDWINVMAYDGGDGELHSGYDFAVNSGSYWKGRGFDASRVVLGVPFYARPSWASYEEILAADGSANHSDTSLYNGVKVYYNGEETITAKTKYAAENFGGVMAWEITQDTSDTDKSLLTAISKALE